MADVVLDANAVAQVITFVAPGFLARLGYRLRYPGPERPASEVLVIAVVASLPLVAAVSAALPGAQRPTQVGYVAFLLVLAVGLGYATAYIRGSDRGKRALAKLGYRLQPEGSMYSQTLFHMSESATVMVELKDGRRIWAYPRRGPYYKDDGINELYLLYPKCEDEQGDWQSVGAPGLIVPLSEVSTVLLFEEPTGAPPDVLPAAPPVAPQP
jgi:hypothetical protein